MRIFLLWFSIFAFTIFCLSIFPAILRWRQNGRRRVDKHYWMLMLNYCCWLIIFSVLFFSDVFVKPLPLPIKTGFGILRALITMAILVLYPVLLSESSDRSFKIRSKWIVLLPLFLYVVFIIPVIVLGSMFFFVVITISYNLYMIWLSSVTLYRGNTGVYRSLEVSTFIKLMLVYHSASLILYIIPSNDTASVYMMTVSVLPRAVFCLCWGVMELIFFIRREYRKEQEAGLAVSSVFADDFRITAREKDVISCITSGLSNRQTAEKLFISEKTVETHIYSIYRKCEVKNKIELMNLISNNN